MSRLATCCLLQYDVDLRRRRLCLPAPSIDFSTEASSIPLNLQRPFNQHETQNPKGGEDDGKARNKRNTRKTVGGSDKEEQVRVLRAALSHIPKLGWSESAMISGATDVGFFTSQGRSTCRGSSSVHPVEAC
ncbi:hypothetical protein AXF42_Ash010219 [Apostasia shenzhenica]|uniref:Ubiquinone biosynthesis protein COQ9 HTH domain-containing protein n=1 Tax=Apostasia shenzhenica TaxID=1088818 RepID=A0A2I0A9T4_9ASPA|nr:hypothetical protein AXF42_Ash010219 [Apostasia shenzhenica]